MPLNSFRKADIAGNESFIVSKVVYIKLKNKCVEQEFTKKIIKKTTDLATFSSNTRHFGQHFQCSLLKEYA